MGMNDPSSEPQHGRAYADLKELRARFQRDMDVLEKEIAVRGASIAYLDELEQKWEDARKQFKEMRNEIWEATKDVVDFGDSVQRVLSTTPFIPFARGFHDAGTVVEAGVLPREHGKNLFWISFTNEKHRVVAQCSECGSDLQWSHNGQCINVTAYRTEVMSEIGVPDRIARKHDAVKAIRIIFALLASPFFSDELMFKNSDICDMLLYTRKFVPKSRRVTRINDEDWVPRPIVCGFPMVFAKMSGTPCDIRSLTTNDGSEFPDACEFMCNYPIRGY